MSTFENPFPVGMREEGFSLYLPPYGFKADEELPKVLEANRANAAVAARRITGSFIYAHPADYVGRPMLHAGVADWRKLFAELHAKGIDTVIFQAALWRELKECFYHSRRYTMLKQFGVIEAMLEAAEAEQTAVYMGGYGSVAGWAKHLSEAELVAEIEEHRACFKEISKLGKFSGCYFPCETAYHNERNPEAERRMHRLYRAFSDTVKEFNPDFAVVASPAGYPYEGKQAEFLDFWNAVLLDSGVDIIMPQDTVGNCWCRLDNLPIMWQWWHDAAKNAGITLWGHIELFERRSFMEKTNLYPASPERVACQIACAAAFVQKMVAWEVPYFASNASGAEGERLSGFLLKNNR